MAALFILCTLPACDSDSELIFSKPPIPIRYLLLEPSDGTVIRRGDPLHVRVIVFDGPERLGCTLSMGVTFTHPDGRPDNSYLPGAPQDHAATPYPMTLEVQLVVPIGTPEGNSFIPSGSRVTSLRPGLYCRLGVEGRGPGIIGAYPVID